MKAPIRCCLLLFLPAALGCSSSSTGPTTRPETELTFIQFQGTAPPFVSSSVSFFAKRGEDRQGQIFFQDSEGKRGEEFARLKIDATSLRALPDGTPIADGDSVLITMRVVDPLRILVELSPTGLQFNPGRPAKLKLDYDFADKDFDRDGDEDSDDQAREQEFSIWRQETTSSPWIRLGTVKVEGLKELEASLTGFSRLAIAY